MEDERGPWRHVTSRCPGGEQTNLQHRRFPPAAGLCCPHHPGWGVRPHSGEAGHPAGTSTQGGRLAPHHRSPDVLWGGGPLTRGLLPQAILSGQRHGAPSVDAGPASEAVSVLNTRRLRGRCGPDRPRRLDGCTQCGLGWNSGTAKGHPENRWNPSIV